MSADTHSSLLFFNFIFSFIMAFACAFLAKQRGRHLFLWFTLGLFTGIFALLALFLFFPSTQKPSKEATRPSSSPEKETKLQEEPQETLHCENALWYYLDLNHKQQGPVSFWALQELWKRGKLEGKSYVWCESMSEWQRVETLASLLAVLNQPHSSSFC